jgi:putative exporter of polyketide antibiotics
MFLLLHLIIVSILYFLRHDRKDENSAHRLSLATRSHRSLANTERPWQVCFEGELSLSSPFLLILFLLNTHCSVMGTVKTQSTD